MLNENLTEETIVHAITVFGINIHFFIQNFMYCFIQFKFRVFNIGLLKINRSNSFDIIGLKNIVPKIN